MVAPKKVTGEKDWRSLPRVDPKKKKSERISIRMTAREKQAILERAAVRGMDINDYIVSRALGKRTR